MDEPSKQNKVMRAMLHTLLTDWHLMRWLRLGLGILLAVQAIIMHDAFAGIIAGFFFFQVVTNAGCCAGSCAVPVRKQVKQEEVSFEEVKDDE